ncbi:MAG: hypothetical protein AB1782_20200 [Cyanobacteriota bacterium]
MNIRKFIHISILILLIFTLMGISVIAKNTNIQKDLESTISIVNNYVINYKNQTKKDLIEEKLLKNPGDRRLLELKLDLMYATDLFAFLWTEEDYDKSLGIIQQLKKANYAIPKMYLYESLYYKNQGEWDIASQLASYTIKKLETNSDTTQELYLLARAQFELGIYTSNQDLIINAIEQLEVVLNQKPDNIIYLSTINEMFRYIEVPEDVYNSFSDRINLYQSKLSEIQKELSIRNPRNLFYKKNQRDDIYYEEVMKPITEEILRRWKSAKTAQSFPADQLYFFQVTNNRKIINIRLISNDNASENLIKISESAIENTIVPYLPENYPLKTMNIIFIFSYH